MELRDLYRDVILDHNRRPRNFGRLEDANAHAVGHNPLCGDRLALSVKLAGDRIEDIRFEGQGCAISTASASLMSEAVKGLDREAVRRLFDTVHALLTREDAAAGPELGKLAALSGVREFPSRVKCASLCWHTLNAALDSGDGRGGGDGDSGTSSGGDPVVTTEGPAGSSEGGTADSFGAGVVGSFRAAAGVAATSSSGAGAGGRTAGSSSAGPESGPYPPGGP